MRAPFWTRSLACRLSINALPLIAVAFCPPLFAANPNSPKTSEEAVRFAEALLEEALACEIYGLGQERDELLAKAEALAPEHPGIKWQRGMVFADGRWTPAEEVAVDSVKRAVVAEYVAKRDAAEDSPEGNLALAQWCQERKLFDQERAHLVRVLKYEPDHARARARLGYVRIDDEWISREEIANAIAEEVKAQASIKKNGVGLQAIVKDLADEHPAIRDRAAAKVSAIRDVDLIPVLERVVAGVSEEASLAAVHALAAMPEKEATLSLARFAVLSPNYRIRGEASDILKDRPFDQFVPPMIASLRGRVRIEGFSLDRRADARLVYRQVISREGARSSQLAVHDVVYVNSQPSLYRPANTRNLSVIGGAQDDRTVAMAAASDSFTRTALAQSGVAIENAHDSGFNSRVSDVLQTVTGEALGPHPRQWWNWWDQYNELLQSVPNQDTLQYTQSLQAIGYERYPDRPRISGIHQAQIPITSCFAAGTPVLTNRGDVAIEQIRIGDLVLSQDVESGEIAFKPVLETTVRPPAEILRVEHEKGSFRCTGGHPFWVSGEGWVHAKRLKSGMELHSLDGSVRVSDVVSDGEESAYNLIVADFANYFVGKSRILSHDNASRQPTDAVVPGLAQK